MTCFQKNVSDGTNFKFVIPEEGGTIWTDNFAIPITAANPVDAIMLIDFFYQAEIAATLAEYINYVTPVPAAQAVIEQHAAKAPTAEDKAYLDAVADQPAGLPRPGRLRQAALLRGPRDTEPSSRQFQSIFEPIVLA